jgi:hypothetical protein
LALLGESAGPADRLALAIRTVRELLQPLPLTVNNPLRVYLTSVVSENALREMDRWLALLVLTLSYNCGWTGKAFRRMSFKELRRQGLPSLLHFKRTYELSQ